MRLLLKFIIFLTFCGVLAFVYIDQFVNTNKRAKSASGRLVLKDRNESQKNKRYSSKAMIVTDTDVINIWCIFTKVVVGSRYSAQFTILLQSIFVHSHDVPIQLNLICDHNSKIVAKKIASEVVIRNNRRSHFNLSFYDINNAVHSISDIVEVMTPYFSSRPGSYYADSLFYLSLGLHRIAPLKQDKAILLDCDLQFRTNIKELYGEFDKFSISNLFGIPPELSSAYWYALYRYRKKNSDSTFGLASQKDSVNFPGFNSGVMLLRLDRIRNSSFYSDLLSKEVVSHFVLKYQFKAQLGGQDYLTLLGYEHPELFLKLDCGWNRQLCTWWRIHGNVEEFDKHFICDSRVKIYHGNCNSLIPQ